MLLKKKDCSKSAHGWFVTELITFSRHVDWFSLDTLAWAFVLLVIRTCPSFGWKIERKVAFFLNEPDDLR